MFVTSDDLPRQELVELVTEYLEGRLPEPDARAQRQAALRGWRRGGR